MSKDSDIAIRVRDLHKTFRIPLEGGNNLKQRIVNFSKRKKGYREFSPLNGISFEIKKGEFFGIVGRNGSGKSTLLKTIAGIYEADKGHVTVNGKLVPFIELGVGFNPELTGRENVYLNGALLGFSREEMTAMYDEIVDFAELHDFMDEKLKNYSSGMQVRLAFSIAIRAEGDILLLDEVLAVGDSAFQEKCYDYFDKIKRQKKTIILVTHSMSIVNNYCTKALYLKDGKVDLIGSPEEVANRYEVENFSSSNRWQKDPSSSDSMTGARVTSLSAEIVDKRESYTRSDEIEVKFNYELAEADDVIVKFALLKDGVAFSHINSLDVHTEKQSKGSHTVSLKIALEDFLEGVHDFNWGVFDRHTHRKLAMQYSVDKFLVVNNDLTRSGSYRMKAEWRLNDKEQQ